MKFSAQSLGTVKYFFLTLVILLIPLGYYFFYHVPSKQAYYTSRNLRLLSELGTTLTSRLESYQSWIDYITLDNNFVQTEIKDGRTKYAVALNDSQLASLSKSMSPKITEIFSKRLLKIENLTPRELTFQFDWDDNGAGTSTDSTTSEILFVSSNKSNSLLHIYYRGKRQNPDDPLDRYSISIKADVNLENVIQPLLRKEVFDNILIVENNAKARVIYQMQRDEFIATRLDSSATIKNSSMSRYDQVDLSNSKFQLYSHPLQIANLVEAGPPADTTTLAIWGNAATPLDWTIIGLVGAKRFHADSRTISYYKISLFVFLILIIVISLPLIKLHFIGPLEEISRLDLTLAISSLIFGAGVITFLLITIYSNKEDQHHLDQSLEAFNDNVKTHLFQELDSLYNQAHDISVLLADSTTNLFDEIQTDSTKGIITSFMQDKRVWPFDDRTFPHFSQIAWLDRKTGHQVLKLDPDPNTTPLVNVNRREYYQRIKNNTGWRHDFNANGQKRDSVQTQYFIEPIISITTGEKSAVVSFMDQHHPGHIVAVSVDFISLRNVITPDAFGFCIMDDAGNALFHSDDDKSLQENFLKETDNNPMLASALFSRTRVQTTVVYQGHEHRITISPIKDTDWHLITFVALASVHSAELSATVLSFTLFLGLLFWYALLFLLFRLIFPHKNFSWLMPHWDMDSCYKFYSIVLFLLAGIYFSITFIVDTRVNLILAFVLPPINLLFMYLLLQFRKPCRLVTRIKTNIPEAVRHVILIVIFLACVIIFHHNKISIAFLLFFIFIALFFLSDIAKAIFKKFRLPFYYVSYVASVMAFLMMTSVMPAIGLFRLAYNEEMNTLIKHVQLSFTKNYAARTASQEETYRKILIAGDSSMADKPSLMRARLADTTDIYLSSFQNSAWVTTNQPDETSGDRFTPSILSKGFAKLGAQAKIVHYTNWQLYREGASDTSWYWSRQPGRIRLNVTPPDTNRFSLRYVESDLHPFRPPQNDLWAWGMLALFIALTLLVIYFVRHVLVLDITLPEREDSDAATFDHNTIYIGPHGSGKSNVVRQLANAYIINFRTIDNLPEYLDEIGYGEHIPGKNVILDHFAQELEDETLSALKLKLIKRLVATFKKNVIIVSSIDPLRFFADKFSSPEDYDSRIAWIHTLNSFTKVFHNIRTEDKAFNKKVLDYSHERTDQRDSNMVKKNGDFCQTLIAECNHTPFLRQVGMELLGRFDFNMHFFNKKTFFTETLQRAETYYQSIWHDCTIEEKIVLINLVRNKFFVQKDSDYIRLLLQKGLIVRDDNFRCFNTSFELFVKHAKAAVDIREWQKRHARNWGNFRTLAISLIVAVALFIFLTQRETFNQWIALVSTFVAGVPVILRLFSLVNFGRGKTQTVSADGK